MPTGQLTPVLRYIHKFGGPGDGAGDAQLLERFARHRDEGAFEVLVRRHGPMVLGVCRRLLRDAQEAEDAFQCTFLLLARKAGSLRQPELLGPWLHGVACRTARKARALAVRRPAAALVNDLPAPATGDDLVWRDLRPVLDEAIRGLPSKYRQPVVLCYLEGLTHAEAARRLGCPPGTVATRLSRARAQLRARLTRRGVVLSAGLLAAAVAREAAAAPVPQGLLGATVRAAVAGAVPAKVVLLTEGIWRSMIMERWKLILAAVLAVGLVGSGAGVLTYRALAGESVPGDGAAPAVAAEPEPAAAPRPVPVIPPAQAEEETAPAATYRTPHFVVEGRSRRIARLVGEAAERERTAQAMRWLGNEMPDWPQPCSVRVKITDGPSSSTTAFAFAQGKVFQQNMRHEGPLEQILANTLPHEVTHTVLAYFFGGPLPRWADEGGAMLAESDEEQQHHEETMCKLLDTPDRIIPLPRLLPMKDYPKDLAALYAEGYSLTRFLVARKDRKTFLAFVKQGQADGWDEAVRNQYGFSGVGQLEKEWLADLSLHQFLQREAESGQTLTEPIGRQGPTSLGVAVVVLDDDGRVVVRQQQHGHQKITTFGPDPVVAYKDTEHEQVRRYRLADVSAVRLGRTGLEPVKVKELTELLREETTVLVAEAGQSHDPLLAKVVRKGTVILTLPPQPQETVPAYRDPPSPPKEERKEGNLGIRFSLPGQQAPFALDLGFPHEDVQGTSSGARFDPSR